MAHPRTEQRRITSTQSRDTSDMRGVLSVAPTNLGSVTAQNDLLERTESRRVHALSQLNPETQSALGQFFTPNAAAQLIASMVRLPKSGVFRVLDPGAGSGSLSAAIVARVLREAPKLKLELVALEYDSTVADTLRGTLADCVAIAAAQGTEVSFELMVGDYVEIAPSLGRSFDLVIMNPPYGKLAAGSANRTALAQSYVDTPNIYAAFVALGISNLDADGQLVAITPRSFTNGTYFEPFRRHLLDQISLDRLHIFESRSTVFSDTGVLQENIIFAGTLGGPQKRVMLSASVGHNDEIVSTPYTYDQIVYPGDANQFIRIPANGEAALHVDRMLRLTHDLADLGLAVSTGRVVDFRSREQLLPEPLLRNFPMVYPSNIKAGQILHPLEGGKPQRFSITNEKDERLLVPEGTYVVIKRFSAKEERRRLIAGVWSPQRNGVGPVAFDNKLNYFHVGGKGMDAKIAVGLCVWLNSTPVDVYFRTFSGHTQVNATDLRSMRFPSLAQLHVLGALAGESLPAQDAVDQIVDQVLDAKELAA